jgi:hypothetical protein
LKRFKSNSIVFSYLSLVAGVYYFDWMVSQIYVSFVLDVVLLFLLVILMDMLEDWRTNWTKVFQLPILLIGAPVLLLPIFFIAEEIHEVDPELSRDAIYRWLWELFRHSWIPAGLILIGYVVELVMMKHDEHLRYVYRILYISQFMQIIVVYLVSAFLVSFGLGEVPWLFVGILAGLRVFQEYRFEQRIQSGHFDD